MTDSTIIEILKERWPIRERYKALYAEALSRREEANRLASSEKDRVERHFAIDRWESRERRSIDGSPEIMTMLAEATKHASREQILILLLRLTRDYAFETSGVTDYDLMVKTIAARLGDPYWQTMVEPGLVSER